MHLQQLFPRSCHQNEQTQWYENNTENESIFYSTGEKLTQPLESKRNIQKIILETCKWKLFIKIKKFFYDPTDLVSEKGHPEN